MEFRIFAFDTDAGIKLERSSLINQILRSTGRFLILPISTKMRNTNAANRRNEEMIELTARGRDARLIVAFEGEEDAIHAATPSSS